LPLKATDCTSAAIHFQFRNNSDDRLEARIPLDGELGATLPDDATDSATLLRNADRALYRAKSNGRNRVEATG
jgi:GGDEF domain-containing protein